MKTESRTLHFELAHLKGLPADTTFTLLGADGKRHALTAYRDAPHKRAEHKKSNKALALLSDAAFERITHFLENVPMPASQAVIRQVSFPSLDAHSLPEIALRFVHVPKKHVRLSVRHYRPKHGRIPHPLVLTRFGVQAAQVAPHEQDDVRVDAADVQTPYQTAVSFIFMHPDIGTVNPVTAQYVLENHVQNTNSFNTLVQYIEHNGPGSSTPYYTKTYSEWTNPQTRHVEPMPANTDLTFSDGKTPDWPTPVVNGQAQASIPQYSVTGLNTNGPNTAFMQAVTPAVNEILISTKDDTSLNGQLWTQSKGTTQKAQANVSPAPPAAAAVSKSAARAKAVKDSAAPGFTAKNLTSAYGLDLYNNQISFDYPTQTLTFPVKNWASRYLGAYVQFLKQDGTPIKKSDIWATNPKGGDKLTWSDNMPSILQSVFEPSDTKLYLDLISSGNVIFGIPVPPLDSVDNLQFLWPEEASTAQLLMGGLGVANGFSDWDTDVDVAGVLGTAIVCYGITGLSLVFTVKIVNPFMTKFMGSMDDDAKFGFYAVCGVIGVSALVVGGFEHNTTWGKTILTKLAGIASGLIFSTAVKFIVQKAWKTAIEEIIAEAVGEITAEEALEQVPIAGQILQIASVASDIAGLAATTIECLLSPATYDLEIQRQMNVNVSVGPDPAHGKDGHDVWPLVSDHYVIQVKYPQGNNQGGGTTYTMSGPMPGDHEAPIVVTFTGLPAGGKIEVIASIYSSNNWLAGQWNSGWVNGDPDSNNLVSVSGNITENLVPLTASTTYSQKQTLAYSSANGHYWQVTQFSIDATLSADLDKGGVPDAAVQQAFTANGNPLAANAAITVNTAGSDWTLNNSGVNFHIWKVQTYNGNGQTQYELAVQNTTNPAPGYVPPNCGPSGNNLCHLQNITINNSEYELAYAWQASGMNMPVDFGTSKQNTQMYAMQSISTLGQPEEQIIEPAIGFSNPMFIAYNEFGLRSLFTMPSSTITELNAGGPVPQDIQTAFSNFKVPLPANAAIQVVTSGKDWTIGVAQQNPAYDLQVISTISNGQTVQQVAVYSWPVPGLTNFYVDPRYYSDTNQLYYLRGIDLSIPFGQSQFNYDATTAWGAFTDITIQDLAVHPDGYVVGVDYENHKLLAVRLPAAAVAQADAPLGAPLSGLGIREGLMNKPTALTITSDGRILILEEGNSRIQAFDVKGNPVPCFSVNQPSFPLAASFIGDLNGQTVSAALIAQWQQNVTPALAPAFSTADNSSAADLDNGVVDSTLQAEFVEYGYATAASQNSAASTFSAQVNVAGKLWFVTVTDTNSTTNTSTSVVFDVRLASDQWGNAYLQVYRCFTLDIDVSSPGAAWTINDTTNSMTFAVTNPKPGTTTTPLTVQQLVSYMPLREVAGTGLTYLDLAVEAKGFIYVLYQQGETSPVFGLDIYNPDGSVLLTQPQTGINAARMTVDQWRSLFTLNFQTVLGPGNRTEPGISEWEPSTPGAPSGS
jgi:hypothetical protein